MTTELMFDPQIDREPSVTTRVNARVGQMLNIGISSAMDVVCLAREGIPLAAVERLEDEGFQKRDIDWIINPRTLRDRKYKSQRLTREESDRWFRAARVLALAVEVFGDKQKAQSWLHTPRRGFGGETPVDLMTTEAGTNIVEEALNAIDAGFFA